MKLEKSAQPVSELELAAGEELQPVSAEVGDGGDGAAALAAVDVPVSIGMSSKLAVHTGPGGGKERPVTTGNLWKASHRRLDGAGAPTRVVLDLRLWSDSTLESKRAERLQPVSTSILSSVLGLAASNGSLFTSSSSESVLSSLSVLPELLDGNSHTVSLLRRSHTGGGGDPSSEALATQTDPGSTAPGRFPHTSHAALSPHQSRLNRTRASNLMLSVSK